MTTTHIGTLGSMYTHMDIWALRDVYTQDCTGLGFTLRPHSSSLWDYLIGF